MLCQITTPRCKAHFALDVCVDAFPRSAYPVLPNLARRERCWGRGFSSGGHAAESVPAFTCCVLLLQQMPFAENVWPWRVSASPPWSQG